MTKGTVFYGMHFYPGVAEYQEPNTEPYRVFLNEATIRSMDPTFAGRPVFVHHVDDVSSDVDELRKEADGWVIESFFNSSDGKHWCKFLAVTERAEEAIRKGWQLSNCYIPKSFAAGGLWNGVAYAKEITGGEYEHLAIVPNPRYEESVIMNPEEFKKYNENLTMELKRLANTKEESKVMKFFKRQKVDNAADLESMSVVLPKSGKEMTITEVINNMDEYEIKKKEPVMADMKHMVKMHDDSMMNVGDLMAKHKELCDALEEMKKPKEDAMESEEEVKAEPEEIDVEGDKKNEDPDADQMSNKEDEEKKVKEEEKKANAKAKAERLRNAGPTNAPTVEAVIDLSEDKVARGKSRYGSN